AIPADGVFQRLTILNNGGLVNVFDYASFSQSFSSLTAGTHTFGVAAQLAGGTSATVGGNSSSVLQGELSVTIIKK
ncbi:MAG: hypothetical protein M3R27_12045, partial [Bacteroidota bacterium]|nr:hypothetical protein [Bacteroidota bacterium]